MQGARKHEIPETPVTGAAAQSQKTSTARTKGEKSKHHSSEKIRPKEVAKELQRDSAESLIEDVVQEDLYLSDEEGNESFNLEVRKFTFERCRN